MHFAGHLLSHTAFKSNSLASHKKLIWASKPNFASRSVQRGLTVTHTSSTGNGEWISLKNTLILNNELTLDVNIVKTVSFHSRKDSFCICNYSGHAKQNIGENILAKLKRFSRQ